MYVLLWDIFRPWSTYSQLVYKALSREPVSYRVPHFPFCTSIACALTPSIAQFILIHSVKSANAPTKLPLFVRCRSRAF